MSGTTTRYGLQYPSATDPTNIPGDVKTALDEIDALMSAAIEGLLSALPTAGILGRIYYATDENMLFFDTSASWLSLGPISIAGGNITASSPGQSTLPGSTGLAADSGHRHARESWGMDADIEPVGGSAASGSTGRVADAGHIHPSGGSLGDYKASSGVTPDTGWMVADGTAISRTTYSALWVFFGETASPYGQGDGSTTFNLPNMIDRTMVGCGGSYTLGQTFGEKYHQLTVAELAIHGHAVNDPTHAHSGSTGTESISHTHGFPGFGLVAVAGSALPAGSSGLGSFSFATAVTGSESNGHTHNLTTSGQATGITVQTAGSNTPHNNVQPSMGVSIQIRVLP